MPESATLNHAARIVAAVAPDLPADAALRHYFLETRRLHPRERRAISRVVFAYFRWLQWLDSRASLQKQLARAAELHERFAADPKSVKPETLAARAVPDWLRDEMELPTAYLQQLQRDPALWLRARPGTAAKLAHDLGDCEPPVAASGFTALGSPLAAPNALRYAGRHDLFISPQFHAGAFEIQDLASQLVSIACAPQPKQTWWDACAGEGGKTLHLADLMENKGLIWSTDRSHRRLEILKRRAARAQVFNYRTALWDGAARLPTKTRFDGILVDAPCSGVGTWQRNPHARWTTTPADVRELAARQLELLTHAAPALKPGGRLVYSVCTLTRAETTAVASAFTAAHPDLEPLALSPSSSHNCYLVLLPHELNANGMFIAAWRRQP
ncbi:MAG TPA: RsmB/NOP family class I SAM-dependent RNA methyltransferase [Opitutus sp.]|nr:RsmB/NOP family class I SAM-dependent RNA methyltransferase [Opitutus sp.]